jgi:hypothetical protein
MHDVLLNAHHLFGLSDAADPSLHHLIEAHANLMGGQDLVMNGHVVAQTAPGLVGGGVHNIFENGGVVASTHATLGHGVDVVGSHGAGVVEHLQPNIAGGTDVLVNGSKVASAHTAAGGVVQVFDAHGALAGTVVPNVSHTGVEVLPGFGSESAIGDVAAGTNFFSTFFS